LPVLYYCPPDKANFMKGDAPMAVQKYDIAAFRTVSGGGVALHPRSASVDR